MTDCFFNKYHKKLYNSNKPYQYVGGEFLSANKDFDKAKVTLALTFPDKYEIGISNLGHRVLYDLVNRNPDFMSDRVYAPDSDFKEALKGSKLYALESKKELKDFDLIGFSLQYELAYPTVLAMLEMSGIEYLSSKREEGDPIIIAGGPCCYNPLPMNDFIDCFLIGDGEDLILEVCEAIKDLKSREDKIKAISKLEGVYCPKFHSPLTPNPTPSNGEGSQTSIPKFKVKKRIAQINYENAPKSYPIPFCSSVHDRAIVEIRRGCGRMCRFCQPGHVTLPVRERSAEDIIKIAKELVKNTGYDEYSLLSLSSNDYSNIKEVIKELSVDFDEKKVSVSLPSQRIDGFNLELAQLVQSVRKSTMTLAPEAGSQRLRDVIKKNISEKQILDAVLTLYEHGWSRIKFYFITGLPTETIEDMDEMAELLNKIKTEAKRIKREKELKHGLDITCTLSIFVPKPFTPFQFAPQPNLDEISERIYYLKEKTKHLKGVKIKYHDKFVSQIEAVLSRGDEKLCDYIEALYKKGCYLDAWNENFSKRVWEETAQAVGVNLDELSQKQYPTDVELPWEFIDIGVEKSWLVKEWEDALKNTTNETCQSACVNCGVCKNFTTKKIMDKPYSAKLPQKTNLSLITYDLSPNKYRIKLTKTANLRYFSHLDWQNTFLKALSRSGLNIAFSQGFNPSMKISLGIALPLFLQSECELVDIEIYDNLSEEALKEILQKVMPDGCEILKITKIALKPAPIDHLAQWAQYEVVYPEILLYDIENVLSSEEILLTKKNKKGLEKQKNIKPSIKSYKFENGKLFLVLKVGQGCNTGNSGASSDSSSDQSDYKSIPAIRADDLMKLISKDELFDIKRTKFFDENLEEL